MVLAVPVPPQLSFTVNVTRYTPALANEYVALTVPAVSFTVPGTVMLSNVQVAVCVPGLSVNEPVKVTDAPFAKIAPLAGAVIVTVGLGFVTVTVCWQLDELFAESVAVQVMVVAPTG